MTRLTVGQNSYLDMEHLGVIALRGVSHHWWQITFAHRVPGAHVGYMVCKTTRGYEVYFNPSDSAPRVVLPNRCTLTDEEE